MIYYNYIDPENAKPGDLCFCKRWEGHPYNLYFCVKCKFENNIEGNQWAHIQSYGTEYESEIINNKPTPALIARFTGNSRKSLEIHGRTLVRTAGGIASVGKIKQYNDNTVGYFFETEINGKENAYGFDSSKFGGDNLKQAEAERARLIEWLEEA